MFSGSVPVQLTQLTYLQYLDLAYNKISGYIPHTLANMKAMTSDHGYALENPLHPSYGRTGNSDEDYLSKYDDIAYKWWQKVNTLITLVTSFIWLVLTCPATV